jgi:hypothetical protein
MSLDEQTTQELQTVWHLTEENQKLRAALTAALEYLDLGDNSPRWISDPPPIEKWRELLKAPE